ncbi:hypothetical protein H8356DRAFT_1356735 [Neocallimastix lanati (nom. inval.)]|nr:hypothetical protein H8356DRAFT_1356735 [Neocallimastix sp. JGI-2020a]
MDKKEYEYSLDMNFKEKYSYTTLMQYYLACGEGHVETTKILLGNCSRNIELTQLLLEVKANTNYITQKNNYNDLLFSVAFQKEVNNRDEKSNNEIKNIVMRNRKIVINNPYCSYIFHKMGYKPEQKY